MCLKNELISEYEYYLSETDLKLENREQKKNHARLFLNHIISRCKHPDLEELLDEGVKIYLNKFLDYII